MKPLLFKNFILENDIKFTDPQQAIVDKLLRGWKLTTVNTHHMSGGDFMWVEYPGAEPSYAGRVYKAFFNIGYSIQKQTGKAFDMGVFRVKYGA
tara:strand:+ start:4752 stop:5033 length:282 start_codon:yes stop_codon:yes gene_type:complete